MKETINKNSQTGWEIAVIGMSGRFPGARDIQVFWENIKNGVESITFFSEEELLEAGHDPEMLKDPNYVKAKGIIEDLEFFDSSFFKYTPNEAVVMDPQLRLFHEVAWQVLEDAGYDPLAYPGNIGLYAGYTPNLLWKVGHLFQGGKSGSEIFELMNLNSDYFSALVCYELNLKGPGVTVNTACSTSLAAIDLASRGILTGETEMALAGGVTVSLPWKSGYLYQEGMIMSPDGHCRPFDAEAKGTSSGNGIAIVVLKRLVKAIKDGDHIYAVIKGTAINNDGNRKAGYTALSVEGQAQVIRAAQRMAEVGPESITYIETHGIGTPWGDPLEIEALKRAFSSTPKKRFCRLGFLKANVGHLDAAAGAAGFIKTVLALKHRLLPPAVNFTTPNPGIDFENSPFYIGRTLEEWQIGENPRRAGVSSFGIGGTNAHVVLEEWPEDHAPNAAGREPGARRPEVLLLSAKSKTALQQMTVNLAEYFRKNPGNRNNPGEPTGPNHPVNLARPGNRVRTLADAAYTLQKGRSTFNYRRFLVCTSEEEASAGLLSLVGGKAGSPGRPEPLISEVEKEDPPVVFMFAGPGSQYIDMGREIYDRCPRFRREMDRCFDLLKTRLDYDLKEILYPSDRSDQSDQSDWSEIAPLMVFSLEYSLAKWLMQGGIKPRGMIGDSFGEYTAASLAGVFSLEDVLKLLILRGQLLRENGEISKTFETQVKASVLNKPAIPFISSVTGKWINPGDAVNPRYWGTQLRQTVSVMEGLKEILKMKDAVLVEIGPGMALSTLVRSNLESLLHSSAVDAADAVHSVNVVDPVSPVGLVRPPDQELTDMEYLLNQLGRLWMRGVSIDWGVFYSDEKRKRESLPVYPFDKMYYSIEPPLQKLGIIAPGGEITAPAAAAAPGSALPPNRPGLKTPYAAPRNRVEEIMANLWEGLLGIRPIGIHDDLVELGVDSLKGITFVNRFKEQWGAIIHVTAVFSGPTVAEMAGYLSNNYPECFARLAGAVTRKETLQKKINKEMVDKISIAQSENLVLLKETSPGAGNLFLLHEVSGEIGAYIEFCRLLDTGFNCWGIQAQRLKNYRPQNRTIEEIAAIYIEKMKRIQPEGPYYLVTWSGGGPIGFEMALQMEQRGDPLAFLGFFDCRGPSARLNYQSQEFTLETEKKYLQRLFAYTGMVEKLEKITEIDETWPTVVEVLKTDPSYKEGIENLIRQDRMLTLLNFGGQRIEDLIQYWNLSRTFANASGHYLPPRKLRATLHFFEGTEASQAQPLYWHEYCEKPIIHHRMSGDHYSIFKQPHVTGFARLFSEILKNVSQEE